MEKKQEDKNISPQKRGTNLYSINQHYLLHAFLSYLLVIWENLKIFAGKMANKTVIYRVFDTIAKYSTKHPYIAALTSISFLILASPLLIIVLFAMGAVVITFSGFMFFEGTLITIASLLLFGCLSACFIVFIFFGIAAVTGYCGCKHTYDLWHKQKQQKALKKIG